MNFKADKGIFKNRWSIILISVVVIGLIYLGYTKFFGAKQAPAMPMPQVKVMKVIKRDTPITYEYVGEVIAKNEVQIRTRVSGNLVNKMVEGGATVKAGQPLFQIDQRIYRSAMYSAQANLSQAEIAYGNAKLDTKRYKMLVEQGAISAQTYDTAVASEGQYASIVEANRANLQQTIDDLKDTTVTAPFDGRIDVNDIAVGTFVTAGQTVLASISSLNPVFVRFSISEREYLQLSKSGIISTNPDFGKDLTLILSDGYEYPHKGTIEQVDKGIGTETGNLVMKANFPNDEGFLLPGMFARIVTEGEVKKDAILIPQKAVQQLLDKNLVTVVNAEGKVEQRSITVGHKVGSLWVIESGLTENDVVIIEGFEKVKQGSEVNAVTVDESQI